MCIVDIALKEECPGGLPSGAQIDAVLILYAATLSETIGMLGRITLVVVAV